MDLTRRLVVGLACLAAIAPSPAPVAQEAPPEERRPIVVSGELSYQVIAQSPRLNRRLMGAVRREVQGVPAEPVDSFTWNGVGSEQIEGELRFQIDPGRQEGVIQANWTDEHGDWEFLQAVFIHPEHSSGVRIGTSVGEIQDNLNLGIAHNVYLHGDTGAGMPVLPTVFNHIATWGPADIFLNGEYFANPFEIPAPQWLAHLMLTEGVRRPDGTVRTEDGAIYNPSLGGVGAVEPFDLEVHLVFHDERFPRTDNIPPLFSFFYHLVFEDVYVTILEAENPIVIGEEAVCTVESEAPIRESRPVDDALDELVGDRNRRRFK